jgi:hypothetical protein
MARTKASPGGTTRSAWHHRWCIVTVVVLGNFTGGRTEERRRHISNAP